MLRIVFVAVLSVATFGASAQVEIVDRPIGTTGRSNDGGASVEMDKQLQNELYFQLQMLQQEVQELRGLVEQQSFELKQLKQQRLDDYLDLDRRLSQLSQVSTDGAAPSSALPVSGSPEQGPAPTGSSGMDELTSYRSAIDLVLKKRDFDAGATALQGYLDQYPEGHYAANAQYWLGQIYYQQEDLERAGKWFRMMIEQFPQHQKAPEAKLKLAKVLHASGDIAQAKTLLDEVVASDSSVSSLAREFLKTLR